MIALPCKSCTLLLTVFSRAIKNIYEDIPGLLSPLYLVVRPINPEVVNQQSFSIEESPNPFGACALIPIHKHHAKKKGLAMQD